MLIFSVEIQKIVFSSLFFFTLNYNWNIVKQEHFKHCFCIEFCAYALFSLLWESLMTCLKLKLIGVQRLKTLIPLVFLWFELAFSIHKDPQIPLTTWTGFNVLIFLASYSLPIPSNPFSCPHYSPPTAICSQTVKLLRKLIWPGARGFSSSFSATSVP